MRKFLASLIAGLVLLGVAGVVMTTPSFAAQSLSFTTVVDNLDLRKNTKLHVREYWKSIQSQQVSWSGEAVDVQGGRSSRVKLLIADKSRPLYKGYNIVVTSYDVEKAAKINKGQRVRFTGILQDYSAKRAGAVIEIVDAQLQ